MNSRDYLIGVRIFSFIFIMCFSVSSCHFGDSSDGLLSLAQKKRSLNYSVTLSLQDCASAGVDIEDMGVHGLRYNWSDYSEIAVFGKEFQVAKDTFGDAAIPEPIILRYDMQKEGLPIVDDQYSSHTFDFTAYGKHSNGDEYATLVDFVYPASRVYKGQSNRVTAWADSLVLNYSKQNGLLDSLMANYFVCLGQAKGICTNSDVVMRDSALNGQNQSPYADQFVQMHPKIAVLRLSLAVPAQEVYSMITFLHALKMDGAQYYIEKIVLENRSAEASGISRSILDLNSGRMRTEHSASNTLSITDAQYFWNHPEIDKASAQSLTMVGGEGTSWGTSVYVAIPCSDEGQLDFQPLVTVFIKRVEAQKTETLKYYGTMSATTLREGAYYITAPVFLYDSMDKLNSPAEICEVP